MHSNIWLVAAYLHTPGVDALWAWLVVGTNTLHKVENKNTIWNTTTLMSASNSRRIFRRGCRCNSWHCFSWSLNRFAWIDSCVSGFSVGRLKFFFFRFSLFLVLCVPHLTPRIGSSAFTHIRCHIWSNIDFCCCYYLAWWQWRSVITSLESLCVSLSRRHFDISVLTAQCFYIPNGTVNVTQCIYCTNKKAKNQRNPNSLEPSFYWLCMCVNSKCCLRFTFSLRI